MGISWELSSLSSLITRPSTVESPPPPTTLNVMFATRTFPLSPSDDVWNAPILVLPLSLSISVSMKSKSLSLASTTCTID